MRIPIGNLCCNDGYRRNSDDRRLRGRSRAPHGAGARHSHQGARGVGTAAGRSRSPRGQVFLTRPTLRGTSASAFRRPGSGASHRRDEDGRRTWRPVHRSSSPIARWLLFVVKGFNNFGSRRMRSTPSRHARAHQKISRTSPNSCISRGSGYCRHTVFRHFLAKNERSRRQSPVTHQLTCCVTAKFDIDRPQQRRVLAFWFW
jgi:hypothetical protein